jgi:hypothetical protein
MKHRLQVKGFTLKVIAPGNLQLSTCNFQLIKNA